jgi:hypothetical protein
VKRDETGKWVPFEGNLPEGIHAEYRGDISAEQLREVVTKAGSEIQLTRLSIQRSVPNLEIHFLLPRFDRVQAQRLYQNMRDLSERVLKM